MRVEAEPKLRRRRNESPCGAPVARSVAWVGPSRRSVFLELSHVLLILELASSELTPLAAIGRSISP
jgi:hypothetical protein